MRSVLAAALVVIVTVGAWLVWGRGGLHVDGPLVVRDAAWLGGSDGMDALASGSLRIDGGCVRLGDTTVVWPDGTSWDAEEGAVRLPGGRLAREGDEVSGGGGSVGGPEDAGFEHSKLAALLGDCREPGDEVFLFNATERLDLS